MDKKDYHLYHCGILHGPCHRICHQTDSHRPASQYRPFLYDTHAFHNGNPPRGIREYYHHPHENHHTSNPDHPYPGANMEREDPDGRLCQSGTYQISTNQSLPQGTQINATQPDVNRTVYATISGQYSGTTQIINIPFPYWELSYTIDPMIGPESGPSIVSMAITPTLGSSYSHSGIQGSYSAVTPQFSIQVMDASDPNRIVRTISPPGGINPDLWEGITQATPVATSTTPKRYGEIAPTPTSPTTDPRPWLEKFFEGQRGYYFIINSQYINSYTIKILIPSRYIGQY